MWLATSVILGTWLAAAAWVYALRGRVRFAGLREYLRKGWSPLALPNCVLYACTPRWARGPLVDLHHFPQIESLRAAWPVICAEAQALAQTRTFEATRDPSSPAWFDLGFRTFQRRGWSKFYLQWYGTTQPSAERLCPQTVALLRATPGVNGALFALLPAGARITRHLDPLACSLRLHLGLATPNDARCYIEIDGERRVWRDGEAFVFDETYLHHAHNDTGTDRIILMCDLDRPLNLAGRLFNRPFRALVALTLVPNLQGDRRGVVNRIFMGIAPLLGWLRSHKRQRPRVYRSCQLALNTGLVIGTLYVFTLLAGYSAIALGRVTGTLL